MGLKKWADGERKVLLNQHVHPHWFRSQRASQLASEYGFQAHELQQFFGWEGLEMPVKYSALAPSLLFGRMRKEAIAYTEVIETKKI